MVPLSQVPTSQSGETLLAYRPPVLQTFQRHDFSFLSLPVGESSPVGTVTLGKQGFFLLQDCSVAIGPDRSKSLGGLLLIFQQGNLSPPSYCWGPEPFLPSSPLAYPASPPCQAGGNRRGSGGALCGWLGLEIIIGIIVCT